MLTAAIWPYGSCCKHNDSAQFLPSVIYLYHSKLQFQQSVLVQAFTTSAQSLLLHQLLQAQLMLALQNTLQ